MQRQFLNNIDAARFVLIALVVLNHSFQLTGNAESGNVQYWVLTATKIGVPALSLCSGYLWGLGQHSYAELMRKKLLSVGVPFLMWNTVPFLLYAAYCVTIHSTAGLTRYWLVNNATAFYSTPANPPLYFLRDMLVAFALLGLLRPLLRRWPVLLAALVLLSANYVWDLDGRIIIRNTIPLFVLAGFALAEHNLVQRIRNPALWIGATVLWSLMLWGNGHHIDNASGADVVTWALSCGAVISTMHCWQAPTWLQALGRDCSFTVFLSHWWIMVAIQALALPSGASLWAVQWLAPVATVAAGVLLSRQLASVSSGAALVLTGGRLQRAR